MSTSKKCACGNPAMHGRAKCSKCFNAERRDAYARGTLKTQAPYNPWSAQSEQPAPAAEAPKPEPKVVVEQETITRIEEHKLKKRVKDLEAELRDVTEQAVEDGDFQAIAAEVYAHQSERGMPRIEMREKTSGLAEATPLILASDWHVEHEIRPEQVADSNHFNLEIAEERMERFFRASRWGIDHQRQVPFKIRSAILWWGGDFMQNYLHEDDNESNLLSPTETVTFLFDNMTRGIDFLLEDPEIDQWVFPMNDGNHGRTTKKLRAATRIENSLEVLLYTQLARHYAHEKRIRWILPTSQFTFLHDVYGRSIRFLHGDVFKWGGGIGGLTVPMFRALGRWETMQHADLTCMGHWHQRYCLPNVIVNGSLCGYDPYAMSIGASWEAPVQCMRVLEPKRFSSSDIPLWVSSTQDDGRAHR